MIDLKMSLLLSQPVNAIECRLDSYLILFLFLLIRFLNVIEVFATF